MNILGKLWGLLVAVCLIGLSMVCRLLNLTKTLKKGQKELLHKHKGDAEARKHFEKSIHEFFKEFNKRK
ncbi:hypothetical protein [Candidatus Borreliella tachyglossi]|uniref:hypothetical protein n=1 Tax=Candidatus Borreliella tachyglossi TaxID=1964448 RepID=UPI0040420678